MDFDFLDYGFNEDIQQSINIILNRVYTEQPLDDVLLTNLHRQFKDYYLGPYRSNDKIKSKRDEITANATFSKFLQFLVHYANVRIKNEDYLSPLTASLIKHPYFFYQSLRYQRAPNIITWIEPRQNETVLGRLSRNGDTENAKLLLETLSRKLQIQGGNGRYNNQQYQQYISNLDKSAYSALNSASKNGHTAVGQLLIAEGALAFGGHFTDGFRSFISQVNTKYCSPLNSATDAGDFVLIKSLLNAASLAYGGRKKIEYKLFISHTDINGNSSLHIACKRENEAHVSVANLLLDEVAFACNGKINKGFKAFISQVNLFLETPLNIACNALSNNPDTNEVHIAVIKLLLAQGAAAFNKLTGEFNNVFLDRQNKDGCTPLITVCIAGQKEIAQLLILYGANPNIINIWKASAKDIAPDDWRHMFSGLEQQNFHTSPHAPIQLGGAGVSTAYGSASPQPQFAQNIQQGQMPFANAVVSIHGTSSRPLLASHVGFPHARMQQFDNSGTSTSYASASPQPLFAQYVQNMNIHIYPSLESAPFNNAGISSALPPSYDSICPTGIYSNSLSYIPQQQDQPMFSNNSNSFFSNSYPSSAFSAATGQNPLVIIEDRPQQTFCYSSNQDRNYDVFFQPTYPTLRARAPSSTDASTLGSKSHSQPASF